MYNKHNLAVSKVASKSPIRAELACVAFYGDRTIATDSFRALEMSATGDKHEPVLYYADDIKKIKLKRGEGIVDSQIPTHQISEVKTQYPDIDMVWNRETKAEHIEVTVNAEYLAEMLNVLKELSPFKSVKLKIPTSPGHAILLESKNTKPGEEQTGRGLLMPMNK